MKDKEKIYNLIAVVGETVVVISAAAWITRWAGVNHLFALGATLFAIGRFSADYRYTMPSVHAHKVKASSSDIVLRRLYRQRIFGNVMLLLSAIVMNMPPGFYLGLFVGRSSWLLLFIVFAVFEVYTAFRIPQVMNKKEKNKNI